MRTLHITEASSAGVGRHLMDLLAGLKAEGCESHLVYSPRRMDEVFAARLQGLGVKNLPLEMRRSPHYSDLFALSAWQKYLQQNGPFDIIHAHSTKAGLLARLWPVRGAKIVYTPHCIYTMNPRASKLMGTAVAALERGLAHRTDAIIAVSPDEQQHIRSLGIDLRKVHCIVNGADAPAAIEKSVARARLGLPQEAVLIGFLGRLSQQKDPLLFIRAVAAVVQQRPNICAVVAGTGELESAGRNLAIQLGIASRLHWLGFQTAEDVMQAVDLFAMSSQYEGMPYTLLEAIASGLPVVTTAVGGAALTVEDGCNGFVVPVGDELALASKLELLATNDTLRAEFSAASQARAQRFSIQQMVHQTVDLYQTLVADGAAKALQRTAWKSSPNLNEAAFVDAACHETRGEVEPVASSSV